MDFRKRVERALKRTLFGGILGAKDGGAVRGSVDTGAVRRVLLVRANFRMGNLLLVTPALAALRHAMPRARIDVLGPRGYVDLLAHSPDVDGCIGIDRRSLSRPLALVRLVRQLRRGRYDLALDGGRGSSFLGAFLVRASGSPLRVAVHGARYQRLFNVHVQRRKATHKVDLLLALLEEIGVPATTREVRVALTAAEHDLAAARWQALGLPAAAPVVAINVGARGAKRWPSERVVELVRALRAREEVPILLIAGPEDEARLGEILPQLAADVTVAPRLPVREFAALLSRCAVLVTGDTGPMHLAAAVGVPIVGLFVSPRSAYFAPRGSRHRALFVGREPRAAEVLAAVLEAVTRRPEPHCA